MRSICVLSLRIVGYWKQITAKRNAEEGTTYKLKYYQWLTLLVTELYLDWYFNRRTELLAEINQKIAAYNEGRKDGLKLPPAEMRDLNKISFWEATGAGKTLLLDINILQYRFYAGSEKVDHVILLTPDEGLTKQHLQELVLSGIEAYQISDDMSLFQQGGNAVGVIDAGKVISDWTDLLIQTHAKAEWEAKNVFFLEDGGTSYLLKLFTAAKVE